MNLQIIVLELIYTFLVIFPALFIFLNTKRLYNFSKYLSLKYFSYAFLFFIFAFLVRLIYFTSINYSDFYFFQILLYNNYLLILFEFLFLLPGFYFLMSLIHKHIKSNKLNQYIIYCSFLILFLIVAILDYLFHTFFLMYIVAIIIFFFNSLISYKNYLKKRTLYGQIFSLSMMLLLFAWILNFATQNILDKIPIIRYYIYLINVVAIFIIFFIVSKMVKDF